MRVKTKKIWRKNKIKRIILSVLCITLLMQTIVFANNDSQGFSDVTKEHWAYDYIMQMARRGVVNGYQDGSFKPDANVTRVEFCKMVIMASRTEIPNLSEPILSRFTVPGTVGHWAEDYMRAMSYSTWSYADWYLKNTSEHDVIINRGEAAMGIADIWYGYPRSYILLEDEIKEYVANKFVDSSNFGAFESTVYEASINGLMNGYSDGSFKCENNITRAELCTMLCRAFPSTLSQTYTNTYYGLNLYQDENGRKYVSFGDVTTDCTRCNSGIYFIKPSEEKEKWWDFLRVGASAEYDNYIAEGRLFFFDNMNGAYILADDYLNYIEDILH